MTTGNGKKILLVAHNFPVEWYAGVEIYTYRMAKALGDRGYSVSVLYPKETGGAEERVEAGNFDGITLHRVVVRRAPHATTYAFPFFRKKGYPLAVENEAIGKLFEEFLARERFDLAHFQHLHTNLPFSLPRIAKGAGIPVCLTLHDAWLICPRTHLYIRETHESCTGPESVRKCATCLLLGCWPIGRTAISGMLAHRQAYARDLLGNVDLVSSPSKYLAEVYAGNGFGKNPIVVSPLGIDPVRAEDGKRRSGILTIGCFGSFHEVKNTLFLLEAFKHVRGNVKLVLWGNGDGNYIDRIRRTASNDGRIEYRGPYLPDRLPEMFSEVDLTVVPSVVESYSFVVRESLSGGVPVIASGVGGIPEVIEHGKNGLLFDPKDSSALVRSLQEVVDDPSRIDRLRDGIIPPLTVDEDADGWARRYERLLAPPSS